MKRALFATLVGVGLLATVATRDARIHGVAAIAAWGLIRWIAPSISKRTGRPSRWVATFVVLALLGAALGPKDAVVWGASVSSAGALAAATMIGRGLGITFVTSGLVALIPRERLLARLASTPLAHLAEVIAVAIGLVPELSRELRARSAVVGRRKRAVLSPRRVHEMAVDVVMLTGDLASNTADELAKRRARASSQSSWTGRT